MRGKESELTKKVKAFLNGNPSTMKDIRQKFPDAEATKLYRIVSGNRNIASHGPIAHKMYFLGHQEEELGSRLEQIPNSTTEAILDLLDKPCYLGDIEENLNISLSHAGLAHAVKDLERNGELRRIRFVTGGTQRGASRKILGHLFERTLVYRVEHKSLAAERIIEELPTPNDETKKSLTSFLREIDPDVAEIVYNSYSTCQYNAKAGPLRNERYRRSIKYSPEGIDKIFFESITIDKKLPTGKKRAALRHAIFRGNYPGTGSYNEYVASKINQLLDAAGEKGQVNIINMTNPKDLCDMLDISQEPVKVEEKTNRYTLYSVGSKLVLKQKESDLVKVVTGDAKDVIKYLLKSKSTE